MLALHDLTEVSWSPVSVNRRMSKETVTGSVPYCYRYGSGVPFNSGELLVESQRRVAVKPH